MPLLSTTPLLFIFYFNFDVKRAHRKPTIVPIPIATPGFKYMSEIEVYAIPP